MDSDGSGGISQPEFEHAVQLIKLADLFNARTISRITNDHPTATETTLSCVDYSPVRRHLQRPIVALKEFMFEERPAWASVRWVCMEGIDQLNIRRLAIKYRIHPLALEDVIQNERQRPKLEPYDSHMFLVLPLIPSVQTKAIQDLIREYTTSLYTSRGSLESEESADTLLKQVGELQHIQHEPQQLSLYIFEHTVISIHEGSDRFWEKMMLRMKQSYSKVRQNDATFLVYTLLDILVDDISPVVLAYAAKLRILELLLHKSPSKFPVIEVQMVKRQVGGLLRTAFPLEKVIQQLLNLNTTSENFYLRDVHDHIVQIKEECEGK